MRTRIVVAAVALLAGATTSFYGGRYDPPYDEAKVIADLAKVEPSNAIPSDVRLPEVLDARTLASRRNAFSLEHVPDPERCGEGARDHIDVALSPTTLRVAGRDVLRFPTDPTRGIAPLQSAGGKIQPLVGALDFEARVLAAGGGSAMCANLYLDESTPYSTAVEVVKSFDLSVRLVVRTRATGTGFVSFSLGDRSQSEFAVPVTLRGAEVGLVSEHPTCSRIAPKEGRVDQETLASCVGQVPAPMKSSMTLYVYGAPAIADVVAVLAALDFVTEGRPPQWDVCGERSDCILAGPGVTSFGGDLVRLPP